MKKLFVVGAIATLVAVIGVATLGTTAAFAQGPTPVSPPRFGTGLGVVGLGQRWGGSQNSLVAVAAKMLGMDVTALINELNTGKTIADVAKTKNVSLDKIVNAFIEPRVKALNDAVAAKKITQAQADSAIATMKANAQSELTGKYTPHAYGLGRGYGAGLGFVDANKDGICDNCGANCPVGQPQPGPFNGPRGRWNQSK